MKKSQIAQIYAQAIFELACEKAKVDNILSDFELLLMLEKKEPLMKNFLELPLLPEEAKRELVEKIFPTNLEEIFLNFLRMLLNKNHFSLLPKIHKAYQILSDKHAGRQRVTATTAYPLSKEETNQIATMLEQHLKKHVVVTNVVKQDIIGGIILEIEDQFIDSSIHHQLEKLRKHLITTGSSQKITAM